MKNVTTQQQTKIAIDHAFPWRRSASSANFFFFNSHFEQGQLTCLLQFKNGSVTFGASQRSRSGFSIISGIPGRRIGADQHTLCCTFPVGLGGGAAFFGAGFLTGASPAIFPSSWSRVECSLEPQRMQTLATDAICVFFCF